MKAAAQLVGMTGVGRTGLQKQSLNPHLWPGGRKRESECSLQTEAKNYPKTEDLRDGR